jgi:hypothetical protein
VTSKGITGSARTSTSSAKVAKIDALSGTLAAAEAGSRCASTETGVTGSSTLTGGSLKLSGTETVALPTDPAPNTTFDARDADSGDTSTVIVNQQEVVAGSITVTAVHIVLHGPSAVGDIVLAQSRCAMTEAQSTTPPASTPPMAALPTAASTLSTASPAGDFPPRPDAAAAVTAAVLPTAAAPLPARTLGSQEAQVGGGAFGYRAFNITFFTAAQPDIGPAPTVTLPPTGANPPLAASAPTGRAKYLVAELFSSGELKVSTQGTTSPARSSTSSASVANVGPGPFTAGTLASTCTSAEGSQTGSTTLTDGKLVTSEGDPEVEGDETVVNLPANPAPNTEYSGTIESVGDSFKAVFNEQQASSDSITVNAVHLYLLGPTAKGDLIVGQTRCSRVAEASSTAAGAGSSAQGASVSRGGQSGSGSGAGGSLASTGTETAQPLFVALALLVMGLVLTSWSRHRPDTLSEHRPSREL